MGLKRGKDGLEDALVRQDRVPLARAREVIGMLVSGLERMGEGWAQEGGWRLSLDALS
jgi:hypothetical protein